MLRYIVAILLGALLLMLLGLVFGYLVLDFGAPGERQLTASGALAYYVCDEYECTWEEDWTDDDGAYLQLPPDVEPPDALDIDGELYFRDDSEDFDEEDLVFLGEPNGFFDNGPYMYEPEFESGGWWVEDGYWLEEPVYMVEERPWYVSSFPGFGSMFQQIIPGQTHPTPVRAPAPPPPRPVYPQPSCWISAQPTSVEYGKSSTLQWSSFNASRASLTDFGNVPLSGSRVAQNITNDRAYQLSVSGQGGSGSCYTRIIVRAPSGRPTCVISAYPSTISSGQSSSLAWGSENASSAYLSSVGTVAVQGGTYVAPRQTTTYTLTVFGSQGSSNTCTAQIGVLP